MGQFSYTSGSGQADPRLQAVGGRVRLFHLRVARQLMAAPRPFNEARLSCQAVLAQFGVQPSGWLSG